MLGEFSDDHTAPVQAVGRERPLEVMKKQIVISSGPFWTLKIKLMQTQHMFPTYLTC